MSTVTSPDGTVIDYDRYGDGPAVIFMGGAASYRAIDEATTRLGMQLRNRLLGNRLLLKLMLKAGQQVSGKITLKDHPG
jgi:hypothetical protein